MSVRLALAAAAVALVGFGLPALAQETYKIGSSLGLNGYVAVYDRGWRDGMELAVEYLNAKGGIKGRQIQLFVEDNRSEPQDAVVGYRKMMSSDDVDIFVSGCVSAGNFAAAPAVVREEIPMVLCSILPPNAEEVKWAFSTLPPPAFEVATRFQYLVDHTDVRKIALMHDPSPYTIMMKDLARQMASEYGLEVVAVESYKQDDVDMSVQVGRVRSAGAGAIIKMGRGGSNVTLAKNIRELGLNDILLLLGLDDGSVFLDAAEILGENALFTAAAVQLSSEIPNEAQRAAAEPFLAMWQERYGVERDTNAGARGWDAIMLVAEAAKGAESLDGPDMREALENISGFQGVMAQYNFSSEQHVGVTDNPFVIAVAHDGKLVAK